jgi:hypothetical protein
MNRSKTRIGDDEMKQKRKIIRVVAGTAIIALVSVMAASAAEVVKYSFENNLNDTSAGGGTTDNLTYVQGGSGSGSAQYVAGVAGQAAVFDGNYFTAPDSADNDLVGNTWTIEAFIKRNGAAPQYDRLVLKWDNPYAYHFVLHNGNLDLSAPGTAHPIVAKNTTPATDFGDGEWHHVAVSSDGSNTKAWIDGTVVYSGAAITLANIATHFGLGDSAGSPSADFRFTGWMDEVILHNSGVDQAYIDGRVDLLEVRTWNILNTTTFDGTEPTSDGNATGAEDPGGAAGYDTINGWTWGTDWFSPGGGSSSGDYTGTLFAGLVTVDPVPDRPFEDQLIRVGDGLELLPTGEFSCNWGGLTLSDSALAQAFSLSGLGDVKVTYKANVSAFGAYIYVDKGSGSWTTQAHSVLAGVNTFMFTPTGTHIRIAFVNRDGQGGATDNLKLDSIQVSQVVTPPRGTVISIR